MNLSHNNKYKEPSAASTRKLCKLRKSCSLPTCTSPPGTCMHCACDDRCGCHVGGRCGGRREGSGRSCKRVGCTHDERCLHSNRAACCHCRNLVFSSGRAAKHPRVTMPQVKTQSKVQQLPAMIPHVYRQKTAVASAASKLQLHQQHLTMNDDVLEAELRAFLQDANLSGELALCEYKEWTSRRQYCNLIVLVCGTQFNLHKHPMLFESNKLHRMSIETADNHGGTVPFLELSAFPGGAEMFETLAIYCYTEEISFSVSNLAAMNCAIEFLEMRDDIRQSAKRFLDHQTSREDEGLSSLLQVANAAQTLAQAQPELFRSACAALMETCMRALVERGDTLDADDMLQLLTLPSELFVEFTQRVLSSKQLASSAVRSEITTELYEQATLAQLHRDAQRSLSPSHCSRKIAQQCVQLLQGNFVEAAIEVEMWEEEPLDLTMLFTSDKSDKMLIKIMDDDLSTCVVSPASPLVDASICFANDSFKYARTLPETFVV